MKKKIILSVVTSLLMSSSLIGCDGIAPGSVDAEKKAEVAEKVKDVIESSEGKTVEEIKEDLKEVSEEVKDVIEKLEKMEKPNLSAGATFEAKYFEAYGPDSIKAGTKWVYETNTIGSPVAIPAFKTSLEITAIDGNNVSTKTSVESSLEAANRVVEKTITKSDLSQQGAKVFATEATEFEFLGEEDITVKSGSYKSAGKIKSVTSTEAGDMTITWWLADGVGTVKVETVTQVPFLGELKTETELLEFTN